LLRHARIERWSQGSSVIHQRHAGVKILAILVFLICIATLTQRNLTTCVFYAVLLVTGTLAASLPLLSILRGAAVVLPFALGFAAVSLLAGDPGRAVMLVVRGYLSSFAALLLIATTPMPELIAGLEWLHTPTFLLQVMQFLYHYLTVLAAEASSMRQAGLARAGSIRALRFRQAGAAAGVLFSRSWARAQAIHRAMISRGFEGNIPNFRHTRLKTADAGFAVLTALLVTTLRIALP
jgi:cobalt/nickel transport system permease protein